MNETLHITSGDIAGDRLTKSGIPGEVIVWHDILYDGPRKPGWPDNTTLHDRAYFIEEFQFAKIVDEAFGNQDHNLFSELSKMTDAPLPWIPAAVTRWLQEQPDPETGLGRLETFALEAIRSGCEKSWDIFKKVAAADTPPQYWGDITLWAKINVLVDRNPPLVKIEGPLPRLPQREGKAELKRFRIISL